jgi:hypothetical protein
LSPGFEFIPKLGVDAQQESLPGFRGRFHLRSCR